MGQLIRMMTNSKSVRSFVHPLMTNTNTLLRKYSLSDRMCRSS